MSMGWVYKGKYLEGREREREKRRLTQKLEPKNPQKRSNQFCSQRKKILLSFFIIYVCSNLLLFLPSVCMYRTQKKEEKEVDRMKEELAYLYI